MTNSETKNFSQNVSSSYHLGGKCSNECKKDSLNVPKLRFKGYNEEWKQNKLGNLFEIKAGGDIDNKKLSKNKNEQYKYPVYANALQNNGLYGYSDIYKISGETITVTGRGDVGHAIARKENYYPIVRLLILKPIVKQDVDFWANTINNTRIFVESTGVPQLTAPQLAKIKIYYPSLPEQEKIAAFLTLIDKKIEKQKELVELLKKYKRGLLSQIFSQKLRFKDDNGNWKKIKLDKIGYFLGGGTPSKNKLEYWNGNIPWVSSSDISENSIDNINISRFITKNAVNNSSTKICPNGTICIVSRVGVGKLAISKQCVCTSQDFVNFINTTNNNNYYIAYYLKEIMKRKVLKTQGTSIKGITSLEIKNIQISLPKIEIQNKIASLLKYNDYLINANESFIKFLIQYKKGLLQQLFI